jgi:hypothetical protein
MTHSRASLHPASEGRGKLLQRDYWAVLEEPELDLHAIGHMLCEHFEHFAPPGLVRFRRNEGGHQALTRGDELKVRIRPAGSFGVRVVHTSSLSLTLATIEGHPEAGRITFGVYPNDDGDVVVHIRSRARSASRQFALGFLAAGEPMQTSTWTSFIDRIAAVVANGVRDVIHVETRVVEETKADRKSEDVEPTFRAVATRRREGAT